MSKQKLQWYRENEDDIKRLDELEKDISRIRDYFIGAIERDELEEFDIGFSVSGFWKCGLFTKVEIKRIVNFIIAMKEEEIRDIKNKIN